MSTHGVIYLSGPMTGYEDHNFPAFFKAEDELHSKGYKTLNPAKLDSVDGFTEEDWEWLDFMRRDIALLVQKCDSIYLLKGWEESKGARLEYHVAQALGFKVYYEGDL